MVAAENNARRMSAERQEPAGGWRFTTWVEAFSLRHRKVVALGIVLFYVLSFNGLWRLGPDSALYLTVGRNLARGEGYTYNGAPHLLAYPGLPYLIAGAMAVSEKHAVALVDGVMLLMGLGSIYLAYAMFRRMTRPGAAVAMAALLAMNLNLYRLSFEILTDVPFLFGTMLVLLGGMIWGVVPAPRLDERTQEMPRRARGRWWGAAMLGAGLVVCAAMRPMFPALALCVVAAGLAAAVARRQWRGAGAMVVLAGTVVGVYAVMSGLDPRRAGALSADVYEQSIRWLAGHALEHPENLATAATELMSPELPTAFYGFTWTEPGNWMASVLVLAAVVAVLRRWPMAMLWIGVTLGVQLILQGGPVPRYLLPLQPLLVLAWWESAVRVNARLGRHAGSALAMAMYAMMIPGMVRCVGEVWYDQYRRPFAEHYRWGTWAAVHQAGALVRELTPKDAVIVCAPEYNRTVAFLGDRWVVTPKGAQAERLRSRPVFLLMKKADADERREAVQAGVIPRGGIGWTQAKTRGRTGDILILKKAQWK